MASHGSKQGGWVSRLKEMYSCDSCGVVEEDSSIPSSCRMTNGPMYAMDCQLMYVLIFMEFFYNVFWV